MTEPEAGVGHDGMQFGLIFFSSSEAPFGGDKYRLVLESARFADEHAFSSIWIPERHFTRDGWLYPNPAVLLAALARETKKIHLRAGSVVMPLHNPIRVAEEWAVVDNLSGGRTGISFASGWHPADFVFFPERYAHRHEEMYRGIQLVQKLWRGETISLTGGDGQPVEVRTYPPPLQAELPIWITAAGNPKTFEAAGEIGAHVLTHMFNQSIDELGEKIRIYRQALARHGHDPAAGQVSLMLHTFVGDNDQIAVQQARGAFCSYLKSASYLLNAIATSRGRQVDLSSLSEADVDEYVSFVFDRLVRERRVLFGTPDSSFDLIADLAAAGVNEIACQLDFGMAIDQVMNSLPHLNRLRERSTAQALRQRSLDRAQAAPIEVSGPLPTAAPTPSTRLEEVQARCTEEVDVPGFFHRLAECGIQFEARFQGIERLWRRDGEALAKVRLVQSLEWGAEEYGIHPAFLDACFQVLIATLPRDTLTQNGDGLYLPVGLRSFRLHRRPTPLAWSHARITSGDGPSSGSFEGDVRIMDETGQVIVEADGLRLQQIDQAGAAGSPTEEGAWLYRLQWQVLEAAIPGPRPTGASSAWWILADQKGVGNALAARLQEQGDAALLISAGPAFERLDDRNLIVSPDQPSHMQYLLEHASRLGLGCRGVVHLWSLDVSVAQDSPSATLLESQILGCGSLLSLAQVLAAAEWTDPPPLWLVTQGAQSVSGEGVGLSPAQAPLWGFGRALAQELPALWGGLVDLDPQATPVDCAQSLMLAMTHRGGEDQVAFRSGHRYGARFTRQPALPETPRPIPWRADASYLITGGLGDLGLEVSRWAVGQGARHLILLGRTELPPRQQWAQIADSSPFAAKLAAVRELERLGASVQLASVDVADEPRLLAWFAALQEQNSPPIRGVFHAAAEVRGGTLLNLDRHALEAVLRPKMLGGWFLHRLFESEDLDFFVLFSAIPSLLGWLGQGAANYAAANAYLDALAHYRQAIGRPALSITWGPWGEAGLAARSGGGLERLAQQGVGSLTTQQALTVFNRLLPQKMAHVAVAVFDWPRFFQTWPGAAASPQLSELAGEVKTSTSGLGRGGLVRRQLLAADPADRPGLFEAYAREKVGGVLGLAPDKLDVHRPLSDLGLDSLMAIQMKNRLEVDLGVRVPMATFLRGPSLAQLGSEVLDQLPNPALPKVDASPTMRRAAPETAHLREGGRKVSASGAEDLLERLDELTDADVDSLLNDLLAEEEHE